MALGRYQFAQLDGGRLLLLLVIAICAHLLRMQEANKFQFMRRWWSGVVTTQNGESKRLCFRNSCNQEH